MTGYESFSFAPSPYTYLPNFPPSKNIKPSYSRFLLSAPSIALADITPHAKKPSEYPVTTNCRVRVQVGVTNRWRLPAALGSDLLGTSQAIKASNSSKSKELRETAQTSRPLHSYSYTEFHEDVPSHTTRGFRNGLRSAPARLKTFRGQQDEQKTSYFKNSFESSARFKNSREASSVQEDDPFCSRFLTQMHQYRRYIPPEKRRPTPIESFFHISQTTAPYTDTDVVLNALKSTWNLHRNFTVKSGLLFNMINEAKNEVDGDFSSDNSQGFLATSDRQGVSVSLRKYPGYPNRRNNSVFINLDVEDYLITRNIFATALCTLYDENYPLDSSDVTGILSAAVLLQMDTLKDRCIEIMMQDVDVNNVCIFLASAKKYDVPHLEELCEKWLELNAVPLLSSQIFLCQLTSELLEKLLKSQRLFTFDEYSLYKLICNWIFLKQHPTLQVMPSWGTVVTWFMSIPKTMSFLEQDEGKQYREFFNSIHLNGITNPGHLDEISKMNVLPSDWLLKVFSHHYYSLQGGGDMSLMTRFENGSIRHGFIFEKSMTSYNEILSLHGFHFEIKAHMQSENLFTVYMQRLKPSDPALSQRVSERQTFSVRQDREVRYAIKGQFYDGETFILESIGPKSQCFGLNNKSERSEDLKITNAELPVYITFSLFFPPS